MKKDLRNSNEESQKFRCLIDRNVYKHFNKLIYWVKYWAIKKML